jgi:hypothetical protein
MANFKLSQLQTVQDIDDDAILMIVQDNKNYKVSMKQLADMIAVVNNLEQFIDEESVKSLINTALEKDNLKNPVSNVVPEIPIEVVIPSTPPVEPDPDEPDVPSEPIKETITIVEAVEKVVTNERVITEVQKEIQYIQEDAADHTQSDTVFDAIFK